MSKDEVIAKYGSWVLMKDPGAAWDKTGPFYVTHIDCPIKREAEVWAYIGFCHCERRFPKKIRTLFRLLSV